MDDGFGTTAPGIGHRTDTTERRATGGIRPWLSYPCSAATFAGTRCRTTTDITITTRTIIPTIRAGGGTETITIIKAEDRSREIRHRLREAVRLQLRFAAEKIV